MPKRNVAVLLFCSALIVAGLAPAPAKAAVEPSTSAMEVAGPDGAGLADAIVSRLPDVCPSEGAILSAIEAATTDIDMGTILIALHVALTSRGWCQSARDTFGFAINAAEIVLAANATGAASGGRRGLVFEETQEDPPGQSRGAAYGTR